MLVKLGESPKSELKYEKIRNGNRFIYVDPLTSKAYLDIYSYCAGLKCKILHRWQDPEKPVVACIKCWDNGHFARNCKNEKKKCAACKSSGHELGSEYCPKFVEDPRIIVTIQGRKMFFQISMHVI